MNDSISSLNLQTMFKSKSHLKKTHTHTQMIFAPLILFSIAAVTRIEIISINKHILNQFDIGNIEIDQLKTLKLNQYRKENRTKN